ncbi:hypothetical protein [Pseudoalteromonas luteoviolacea]|nr:hypothetical protein [Pseudoalteromonas luteoviolacea]
MAYGKAEANGWGLDDPSGKVQDARELAESKHQASCMEMFKELIKST